MSKSKKILIACAIIFLLIILLFSYDISRRTTLPGSQPQLKERLEKRYLPDSAEKKADTIKNQ